jgi:spermidine/putrescine transport system substrate-binding protein
MADRDELIRLTLRQLQARQERAARSRRWFLGRAGLTAGGLVLGPTLLSGCGDDDEGGGGGGGGGGDGGGDAGGSESDELRISNWPGYIDEETIPAFEEATGIAVVYTEDVNDNEEYFGQIREPLSNNEDIGADLFVVTDFLVARLIELGWLAELDDSQLGNKGNLVDALSDVAYDPERRFSLPWFSGFTGLAYNRAITGRDITSFEELFDPEFAGQVSMLADLRDGLGMVIQHLGGSVEDVTEEQVQEAADFVEARKDQIRRFTGNDYLTDLSTGNLAVCQAYSGDVLQLTFENPDIRFVMPEEGGLLFSDNMVIPRSTRNGVGAMQWMDFVYDPVVNGPLTAYVQFISPVKGAIAEVAKVDEALAESPLIDPPQELLDLAHIWRALDTEEEIAFADIYTAVTTG